MEGIVSLTMRVPPKAEESDTLPYPIETLRHWYVSPFGGRSEELERDQVGLNRAALVRNTELEPDDRVAVGLVGGNPDRPWFFQHLFQVVPLDDLRPAAATLSPMGEVVLPREGPYDFLKRPDLQPERGDAIMLKGAAARRLDGPPAWLADLLGKTVRRPNF